MKQALIPPELLNSLQSMEGFNAAAFREAHEAPAVTALRINPFKRIKKFDSLEAVPWSSFGRYLGQRPSFTSDPLFHAGCYYVQEASSMFIEYLLKNLTDLNKPLRVLDLCAAPGGKSTHILSFISADSLLVANEAIRSRVSVLSENLTKWGNTNVVLSNNDPSAFSALKNYFDVVVVDAPCSGSGLFRKAPEAVHEWTEENVKLCSHRQRRILADAVPSLKEAGLLIYSTCSYSKEENEDIADWLLENFPFEKTEVGVNREWNVTETFSEKYKAGGFRFYPHRVRGEGFYAIAFRKITGDKTPISAPVSGTIKIRDEKIFEIINAPEKYSFLRQGNEAGIIYKKHEKDIVLLGRHLRLHKTGVKAGRLISHEFIPDHQLAMSLLLNESVSRVEVDKPTALRYLKREDIKLPGEKKGRALICFEGHALGWVKILDGRVNNYFPTGWRILKTHGI